MIPDDTFIFNGYSARRYFDDYEVRLRQVLGQDAFRATGGGRHLLYGCPVCKHPWFKSSRREYPRLTPEQLAHLGLVLHADIQAFHQLPQALCPICSSIHLGGIFSVGGYPQHSGYHFLWESALPGRLRLALPSLQGSTVCARASTPAFSWWWLVADATHRPDQKDPPGAEPKRP